MTLFFPALSGSYGDVFPIYSSGPNLLSTNFCGKCVASALHPWNLEYRVILTFCAFEYSCLMNWSFSPVQWLAMYNKSNLTLPAEALFRGLVDGRGTLAGGRGTLDFSTVVAFFGLPTFLFGFPTVIWQTVVYAMIIETESKCNDINAYHMMALQHWWSVMFLLRIILPWQWLFHWWAGPSPINLMSEVTLAFMKIV